MLKPGLACQPVTQAQGRRLVQGTDVMYGFGSDWPSRRTTAKVGGDRFHVVESPATPLLERLAKQDSFRGQVTGILCALSVDPGCIEAHLFLAEYAKDEDDRYAHLARAFETGRALWAPDEASDDGIACWGVTATRPYMRAIAALGAWYAEQDDVETATELYNKPLAMNPVDIQGIRHRLAELASVASAPGI